MENNEKSKDQLIAELEKATQEIKHLKMLEARRENYERTLVRKEARLAESQTVAKLGSWDLNLTSEELEWSDETYRLFDKNPSEFKPSFGEFARLVHPEDLELMQNNFKKALESDKYKYKVEIRIINDSGRKWVMEALGKVTRDSRGFAKSFLGTAQDVTMKKHAEEQLLKHRYHLQELVEDKTTELEKVITQPECAEQKQIAIFDTMTEMVVLHELVYDDDNKAVDYRIIDCNNAYSSITGIKKDDAIGKLGTEVCQSKEPPYFNEFTKVALSGSGENYEYTSYYAPMDKHFMISVVSPQKGQFATITTDISAIKQIEEVIRAKNKELENYLYIVSHDLRSPLINIQGFSQILKGHSETINKLLTNGTHESEIKEKLIEISSESIPKTVDFISTAVVKMDMLIKGLLQISRTGRVEMSIKKVNINKLFEDVIQTPSFQIDGTSVEIDIGDLPDCYGDSNLLNQLFSNILTNALKFKHSERELRISITGETKFNQAVYTIRDNGIGISPRHLDRIWDVFFQVKPKASTSGEGIGLSLVKRITDKHKGKIRVESEEGEGSSFIIELQKNLFTE